jgi:LysM repeat protein
MQPPPRLYKVGRGDTLSGIAEEQLGSANRWPEIFRLNRDIISDPQSAGLAEARSDRRRWRSRWSQPRAGWPR